MKDRENEAKKVDRIEGCVTEFATHTYLVVSSSREKL